MNNNYTVSDERIEEPMDSAQTVEARQENNVDWKEPETIPEEPIIGTYTIIDEPAEEYQAVDASPEVDTKMNESVIILEAEVNEQTPWLNRDEIDTVKSRWNMIQSEFVNEPHTSVEQAGALVLELLERIEQTFANQRTILDEQWINQDDISTEDLRVALQSYRSFVNRLLALKI
jgi:hypothetical protein